MISTFCKTWVFRFRQSRLRGNDEERELQGASRGEFANSTESQRLAAHERCGIQIAS